MTVAHGYTAQEPSRSEVDKLNGSALLEFGTWCGYCRRAEPLIREALADHQNRRCERTAAWTLVPSEALADICFFERRKGSRAPRQTRDQADMAIIDS